MPSKQALSVFWFRRDLRLEDNTALSAALEGGLPVLPLFILDDDILREAAADDARVDFIYDRLEAIHRKLRRAGSSLLLRRGKAAEVWKKVLREYTVKAVYFNRDYEPAAVERDENMTRLGERAGIAVHTYKDQVIFEGAEVRKQDGMPYTVYTPYRNRWMQRFRETALPAADTDMRAFLSCNIPFPSRRSLEIESSGIRVKAWDLTHLDRYGEERDVPAKDAGTYLGPHLRFGTVSIRDILRRLKPRHDVFLGELIWREFFMQILLHYPRVEKENFREKYNALEWRNPEREFERWCRGETGYALVDAGMRQLNGSGYMHNRVRMVCASFLCKHLLTDWRRGEAYFAEKLLDYELSSNNGNWQWAAGTGCDAVPYFRIFNPLSQLEKYDRDRHYVNTWIPGYREGHYRAPVVEHKYARERALNAYKKALRAKN